MIQHISLSPTQVGERVGVRGRRNSRPVSQSGMQGFPRLGSPSPCAVPRCAGARVVYDFFFRRFSAPAPRRPAPKIASVAGSGTVDAWNIPSVASVTIRAP